MPAWPAVTPMKMVVVGRSSFVVGRLAARVLLDHARYVADGRFGSEQCSYLPRDRDRGERSA